MLQPILIILGTLLAWYACQSFGHPIWRILSTVAKLAVGFELAYFLCGHSLGAGVGFVLVQIFWVMGKIFSQVSRVRFYSDDVFRACRAKPGVEESVFSGMIEDVREAGFGAASQYSTERDGREQFIYAQSFLSEDGRYRCIIKMEEHHEVSIQSTLITSVDTHGMRFSTILAERFLRSKSSAMHMRQHLSSARSFNYFFVEHQELELNMILDPETNQQLEEEDVAEFLTQDLRETVDLALKNGELVAVSEVESKFSKAQFARIFWRLLTAAVLN